MKAIILVENGVQEEEYVYPLYRLQEAGFVVEVAGPTLADLFGKHHIKIKPTMLFDDLQHAISDFSVIIIPGGYECPERLRQNKLVLDFLRTTNEMGVTIGAICHGPLVLVSAGLVARRRCTSYVGIRDDLTNAGARYVDAPVAVDGNLVTSPHYRDLPVFMRTILEKLTTTI